MEVPVRVFKCLDCGKEFEVPFGKPKWMFACPSCESEAIVRIGDKSSDFRSKEDRYSINSCCCGHGRWGFRFRGGRRNAFGRNRLGKRGR